MFGIRIGTACKDCLCFTKDHIKEGNKSFCKNCNRLCLIKSQREKND